MECACEIGADRLSDVLNISSGLFCPLDGFMRSEDYLSVLDRMKLEDGSVWTIPITLDVEMATFKAAEKCGRVHLRYGDKEIAMVNVQDCYEVDREEECEEVFGSVEPQHPGVARELMRSPYRIGGPVELLDRGLLKKALLPSMVREIFRKKGWRTVAGFQTRNPIHRAHEYLIRVGMEVCDGVFVNPVVGWKKAGEFSEQAVLAAYGVMLDQFFPGERIHVQTVRMPTRYAGPRDAIFHALVRRNAGCTHFIIGRDHSGVGDYYGAYAAHELARELAEENDLGIELLLMREPFYCSRCGQVVSERTCAHAKQHRVEISGSLIRGWLKEGKLPDERMIRPEVWQAISALGREMSV